MVSRRRSLAAVGGLLVGSATLGTGVTERLSARGDASASPAPHDDRSSTAIDVSVFTAERLRETANDDEDARYRARLAKTALERALPSLSDGDRSIEADVTIVEEPVPADAVPRDDGDAVLDEFASYLETDVPDEDVAADSNLLLTLVHGRRSVGLAYIPPGAPGRASVRSGRSDRSRVRPRASRNPLARSASGPERTANAAVLLNGLALGQNDPAAAADYRSGPYASALSAVVHEVGHNLGLRHDAGTAWRDPDDPSRVYVTPMLTGYLGDEGIDENRFGESLPDVDPETAQLVYTPYFNPRIDAGSLVLE